MKKILFIGSIGLFAMACGGSPAPTANSNVANAVNTPATNTANVATNANKPSNATAAKPAESGPTRISFKKGEIGSTQNISLAAGASVRFILGVTGAQNLFITPASKDLTFKIIKGTDGQLMKGEDGMYMVETKGNNAQKSEIVFEVKNATAKEIKSSIKVEVEDFAD